VRLRYCTTRSHLALYLPRRPPNQHGPRLPASLRLILLPTYFVVPALQLLQYYYCSMQHAACYPLLSSTCDASHFIHTFALQAASCTTGLYTLFIPTAWALTHWMLPLFGLASLFSVLLSLQTQLLHGGGLTGLSSLSRRFGTLVAICQHCIHSSRSGNSTHPSHRPDTRQYPTYPISN